MKKNDKKVIAIIRSLDDFEYDFYFNDMIENFDIIIDGGKNYNSYNDETLKKIKEAYENLYEIDLQYTKEKDFFEYYLKRENGKHWSPSQRKQFINNFNYCDILKIVSGRNYKKTILRGYSQGEEIQVFYNIDEVKNDDLLLLQSLYFGGCMEVIFTSEVNDINEIDINNIYDLHHANFLIYDYNKEEIINRIKEYTKIENIKLYEEKTKKVIKTYYEEI